MNSNLYIFSNGNNDLSYYCKLSCLDLVNHLYDNNNNNINVFSMFTYKDIDKNRLWTNYPSVNYTQDESLCFSFYENKFVSYPLANFFTNLDNNLNLLDVVKFLNFFSCEEKNNNIVVLSGHGGLFQSLLDMSNSKFFASNTIDLCNKIKRFPIDLLILDMCSMNYLEIAYELLIDSSVKNIIFFKDLTPIEGLNITELYNTISECNGDIKKIIDRLLYQNTNPLFFISKDSLNDLIKIKDILSNIGYNIVTSSYENNTDLYKTLKRLLNSIVKEGIVSSSIPGLPLKFIGYELKEDEEKLFYSCYKFCNNSYWSEIVSKNITITDDFEIPKIISFTKKNFEHLILIHNYNIASKDIDTITTSYQSHLE